MTKYKFSKNTLQNILNQSTILVLINEKWYTMIDETHLLEDSILVLDKEANEYHFDYNDISDIFVIPTRLINITKEEI